MAQPSAPDLSAAGGETLLERAEARGKQVLVYTPDGPLGGSFVCSRCQAVALQPDLLDHRLDCPYRPVVAAPGDGQVDHI